MQRNVALIWAVVMSLVFALPLGAQQDSFALTIMHNNDVNAEHEPDSNGDGGAARQASVVRQIRAEVANSLLLDAGNRFTGTLFHIQWLGQDNAQIMNLLGYDAMALGGHEFDEGDEVLAAFVDALEFPVVTANVDFNYSPALAGKVEPWVILEVGGEQVGIIGLVTTVHAMISAPGPAPLVDRDLVTVTRKAIDALTAEGVNKIILLTSIGYESAVEVARQVSGVDVIVSGTGSIFTSNNYVGAADFYPVVQESPAGEPVLIVLAGEHTRILGRLDVEFDDAGVLTDWGGDVILLSRYIAPAPDVSELIATLAEPVAMLGERVLGETTVALGGDSLVCRVEECPLGNLITDALRKHSGAQIAYINGNGFFGGIDAGAITLSDLLVVHRYNDLIETFSLTGEDFVAVLEHAVSQLTLNEQGQVKRSDIGGGFLQLSGARYSADPNRAPGSRIVSVEVLNDAGEYVALDPVAIYRFAGNDYIRKGGEGHSVLAAKATDPAVYGYEDYHITMDYIEVHSPVAPVTEGRITYINAAVEPLDMG